MECGCRWMVRVGIRTGEVLLCMGGKQSVSIATAVSYHDNFIFSWALEWGDKSFANDYRTCLMKS
jgi:hypothetical protein